MSTQLKPFEAIRYVKPTYSQVLADVNTCINLFEELNRRRNFSKWVADWAVGERSNIDFKGLIFNLKKFKCELETGMQANSDLELQLNRFEMIDKTYRQRIEDSKKLASANSQLVKLHSQFLQNASTDFERLFKAVERLKRTGTFEEEDRERNVSSAVMSGVEIGAKGGLIGGVGVTGVGGSMALASAGYLSSVSGASALASAGSSVMTTSVVTSATGSLGLGATGGAIAVGAAATGGVVLVAAVIGCVAYCYAHPKGKENGIKYQQLKFLSDALHTNELMGEFETYRKCISIITSSIGKTPEISEKKVQEMIMDSSKNYPANHIKATRIYDNAKRDNLRKLASEPSMDETIRERMAVMMAEAACKTFLKETLGFSDSDVDKFLQNLQ